MAKVKAFSFRLGERVNVPGKKGIQGIIGLPTHTGEMNLPISSVAQAPLARHAFLVRYLQEDGSPACEWFGDFDLAFANTALDMPAEAPPEKVARKAATRKPARKSKSKKRK